MAGENDAHYNASSLFGTAMNALRPYPLRLGIASGESLSSFMHRLVELNALPYFNWLVRELGVSNVCAPLGMVQLQRLSIISKIPVDALADRQERANERRPIFLGHRVTLPMIERYASRLCLPCFREREHHRLMWGFTPLTHCHIHGSPLIRSCPDCGTLLHWRRNMLSRCQHGHDLTDPRLDQFLTTVPEPDLKGLRMVYECLSNNRDGPHLSAIPLSDEIGVMDLLELVETLGTIVEMNDSLPPRGTKLRYQDPHYHQVLNRGLVIASDWPGAFISALDRVTRSSGDATFLADNTDKLRKPLHIRLTSHSRRPYAQLVSRAIWNYAESRGVVLSPGAFGHAPPDFHSMHMSATDARDIIRVDMRKLATIAKKEKWLGAVQVMTGKTAWLRRSDVQAWKERHPPSVSLTVLVERLRLKRKTIMEINDRGLFGSDAQRRSTAGHSSPWRLLETELDAFRDSLRTLTIESSRRVNSDYVTWNQFTKRPQSKVISFADILAGALARRVRVSKVDVANLRRLQFHLLDALSLAGHSLNGADAANSTASAPMSLRTAIRRYKISWHRFHRAISLGLLKTDQNRFGVTETWVTETAVEEFLQDFTTSSRLAHLHRKKAESLSRIMVSLKIQPYHSDRGLFRTMPIYAWKDIHAVGLSKILAATKNRKGVRKPSRRASPQR